MIPSDLQPTPLVDPADRAPVAVRPIVAPGRWRAVSVARWWLVWLAGEAWRRLLRERDAGARGRRLRALLERLGGIWVKVGQLLSLRIDLFDVEFCQELAALQDRAYGFPGVSVDGNDVEATFEATRVARERALTGEGPTLIEAVTMRMHGHAAHDDMRYVPKELFELWAEKDPIERYEAKLRDEGVDVEAIRVSVREQMDEETDWALAQPMPDPQTATEGVFAESDTQLGDGKAPWSRWAKEVANG